MNRSVATVCTVGVRFLRRNCGVLSPFGLPCGTVTCNLNGFTRRLLCHAVASYEELHAKLADERISLFDVREPDEYAAGRIPHSVNIPEGDVSLQRFSGSCR